RATLCRCGASKNKPFCDRSHVEVGFRATGEPATVESPALAERGGKLSVKPMPNGPLQVEGNLEICAASGRTVQRTTKTFLCRCGASEKKPFCDGSHKKIQFSAE
ncbi:MAG: CDGSH iron-sulfur domain-containing protein, partial [Deltaproteobacteria bacterium]|nr:CDGSH iron-sulfur domain-containing protein [Deltaproteobacteria bacterium]